MHFKLSARELGILEDREAILSRLRDSQDKRTKKTLKPPILVVPEDKSRLICVIERDDSFEKLSKVDDDGDEGGGGGGESAVRRRQRQRQPEEEEQGESRKVSKHNNKKERILCDLENEPRQVLIMINFLSNSEIHMVKPVERSSSLTRISFPPSTYYRARRSLMGVTNADLITIVNSKVVDLFNLTK